jgi:hypothetical protein
MDGLTGENRVSNYNFQDQKIMSEGVSTTDSIKDILLKNLEGAITIEKASDVEDRNGIDWWVKLFNGKTIGIDCKIRAKDFKVISNGAEDDLALETWSVIKIEDGKHIESKVGWTRDINKKTDFILWYWKDSGRWCLISFLCLCKVFNANWEIWKLKYKTQRQKTTSEYGEYLSECTFVPRKVIWRELFNTFGG